MRYRRRMLALVALLVLVSGCSAQPSDQVVQTAIAATAQAAPVWKDKLSGVWIDTFTSVETTIDLEGGTIQASIFGELQEAASIVFDHEEGKTVFIRLTYQGKEHIAPFRFLDDNTLVWEHPNIGPTAVTNLRRKR